MQLACCHHILHFLSKKMFLNVYLPYNSICKLKILKKRKEFSDGRKSKKK